MQFLNIELPGLIYYLLCIEHEIMKEKFNNAPKKITIYFYSYTFQKSVISREYNADYDD